MSARVRPELEAEQALLGACLIDPAQLAAVRPWLEPRHFYRPAHRAFYALLLAQHDAGHPALAPGAGKEVRDRWALDAIGAAARTVPGFGPTQGHTLVANCPNARHAAAYGRMVLETSVRRGLEEHAHRLLNAARSGDVRATERMTEALTEVIAQLTEDWGSADRRPAQPLPSAPPPQMEGRAAERAREHERLLLSALTARPAQIREIAGWLSADDFLDEGHRRIYRAVAALGHRHEPVDELTVLWEVRRRGGLGSTLSADQVRDACRGAYPADPGYVAELVLQASLLRAAATSAGLVRVMALDASVSAGPLLGAAVDALGPTENVRRRLHTLDVPRPGPQVVVGALRQGAALSRTHTAPVRQAGATAESGAEVAPSRAVSRSTP
ncbi:DnaB-like helicase N-terminal domain-containing protein [Streptacidiphilus sp. MAP5-52]|uniref:DnaB-like helicase N-terminal domain-containing protein n=1 Tax=Streptacidiphilus sp. MAP5-52 TaxID=3156267 RepID=UPI0035131408